MRLLVVTRALFAAFALVACGGGTPPPSDETAAHSESKATDSTPAGAASGNAARLRRQHAGPAPRRPRLGGDRFERRQLADDPWMASHQMTPKDVLHGVRPAQGKAQACFPPG